MGLLDDAIREHLDLKRRRGADPEEVERAEREALGPVRRGPEDLGTGNGEVEEPDLGRDGQRDIDEDEPAWDESLEHEPEPAAHAPTADSPPVGDQPLDADPSLEEPKEPAPQHAPDPREPFDHGEETAEYDVESELRREKGQGEKKEGEDVLEKTPDFLQDTPEHDRLWFEQRPPRDFDFDG
jgi:hypothetical protein